MMKFGFIGLSDISEAMCINLIKKSNAMVYVYDASIARTEYVSAQGGVPCEIISDVAERADIVFLLYDNVVDVQGAIYSILGNLSSGKIVIDLSTIAPEKSLEISEMVRGTGADYVDAPVVNSLDAAVDGRMSIFFGGTDKSFALVEEYLKYMATFVVRAGENTSGLVMKACYTLLYAQIQNGVNEMLILASKAGLSVGNVIQSIQASPAQNQFIADNGQYIVEGNYTKRTSIAEMHSQLNIAKDYAVEQKTNLKGLNNTVDLYDSAIDRKLKNHDIAEIYTIVERASHG